MTQLLPHLQSLEAQCNLFINILDFHHVMSLSWISRLKAWKWTALNPDTKEISKDGINGFDMKIDFEAFWKPHEMKKKKKTKHLKHHVLQPSCVIREKLWVPPMSMFYMILLGGKCQRHLLFSPWKSLRIVTNEPLLLSLVTKIQENLIQDAKYYLQISE
jgi:hypothetical protein